MKTYSEPGGIFLQYELWLGLEEYVVTNEDGERMFSSPNEVDAQAFCEEMIEREAAALAPRFKREGNTIIDTTGEHAETINSLDPALIDLAVRAFNDADSMMRCTGSVSSTHYERQWGFYVDRHTFYAFDDA